MGILTIGEGLFLPNFTINKENPDALVDRVFRLTTLFHEARHSDGNGNGASLGFSHSKCPDGHDYAGEYACDENLNGPYTIQYLIITEFIKNCGDACSEGEKETLKLLALSDANRVLKVTHNGEPSKDWDASPEGIE